MNMIWEDNKEDLDSFREAVLCATDTMPDEAELKVMFFALPKNIQGLVFMHGFGDTEVIEAIYLHLGGK